MTNIRRMLIGKKAGSWSRYEDCSFKNEGHWLSIDDGKVVDYIMPRKISAWTRYDEFSHSFRIGHSWTVAWDSIYNFPLWRMRPL